MTKILVGVDLSVGSEHAVAHAVGIARKIGARVDLVLVGGGAEHRRALEALRERWSGGGVELSQVVADGHPDDRLAVLASELDAELIVVGAQGRTGVARFLIGSVGERTTRHADRSVLVARGDAPAGGYRRVVLGTDFGSALETTVRRALPLLGQGARVDLVHCWQVPWAGVFGEPVVAMPYDDLRSTADDSLRTAGNRARELLHERPDVELVPALVAAPPAEGLVDAAAGYRADLIVVGSHGRRGVRRFILGSVAEVTVRHAPCSVLVAR